MLPFAFALAFDVPPRNCAEHRSLRRTLAGGCLPPGEAGCRSVQRQARDGLSLDPDAGEKRRVSSYRASSFAIRGRGCREAALFGYFLALLPKSNSPVGENPRLQFAKAARRVMKGQRTPRQRWIPAFA